MKILRGLPRVWIATGGFGLTLGKTSGRARRPYAHILSRNKLKIAAMAMFLIQMADDSKKGLRWHRAHLWKNILRNLITSFLIRSSINSCECLYGGHIIHAPEMAIKEFTSDLWKSTLALICKPAHRTRPLENFKLTNSFRTDDEHSMLTPELGSHD